MAPVPDSRTHTIRRKDPAAEVGPGEVDLLAVRVAAEMAASWQRGHPGRAEEYLTRHPELVRCPQAGLRLLDEEIRLRRAAGQEIDPAEYLNRFPQWRTEVESLLRFHRGHPSGGAGPHFPEVGETLGEFRLLGELGRGAEGRVFLALNPSLANRPLVLKLTPRTGQEHLSLARLQHTHIAPLYWVQDDPGRNLRILAMPFLGGATLKQLLNALPRAEKTTAAKDLLDALDRFQAASPVAVPGTGPARRLLARASFVQAVCWVGACVAEALQYAHERGLVHLDLKPSNVLLTADAQPMLLDFHLARPPLRPGEPPPAWFGGTPDYMSPEQARAIAAFRAHQPLPAPIDARSDIYSLGMVLYRALGGKEPAPDGACVPLRSCQPQVSVGLADIIHRCLAPRPEDRYPDAAGLAADLRRHLADQPLRGVANRSLAERWRKWRRRRPYSLLVTGLMAVAVAAVLVMGLVAWERRGEHRQVIQAALTAGRHHLEQKDYAGAIRLLTGGLEQARAGPGSNDDLAEALAGELRAARQAQAARDLHALVERLRFLYDVPSLPLPRAHRLTQGCRDVWDRRDLIRQLLRADSRPEIRESLRADLLDLALFQADLTVRLAEDGDLPAARRRALGLLDEAERLCGPSAALYQERQQLAEALGRPDLARAARRQAEGCPPRTPWEYYALGRHYLRRRNWRAGLAAFQQALERRPQSFWPNFFAGLCAYRLGRSREALLAFHACVALAPGSAECYYNRALTRAALGQSGEALRDYDRALEIKPDLARAALNRGILRYRRGEHVAALADLRRALRDGADPAAVHYNLAVVYLAQNDRPAARAELRRALHFRKDHPAALALRARLDREAGTSPGAKGKQVIPVSSPRVPGEQ